MSGRNLPGPRGYPVVGILPMLRRAPLQFMQHAATYGELVPLRMLMTTAYLLNHPAHVEHVLQRNYRNYKKTPMLDRVRPILGNGLVTSEGALWTRQRNLMQPAFHREKLEELTGRMVGQIAGHLERWTKYAASGLPFNLTEDTSLLTLEIALQTFFGSTLGEEWTAFAEAMRVVHEVSAKRVWNVTSITERIPTRENREFNQAIRFLRGIVDRLIAERRAAPELGNDLLGMLMAARDADTQETMSHQQLIDEVMTMMLAGHDTTATMVAWAILILAQHPAELERMRNEVDSVLVGRRPEAADLKTLDFTKRVVQEIARLRPSFWWFARVAIDDDTIGGHPIPAGTTVFISQYLMHTHPALWDEPEKFDPDRFLPERIAKRSRFAYFPFGAGPRVCIGSNFAMMEMQFTLAMIFRLFDVEITSAKDPDFGNLITLRPVDDIWARAKPRRRH